MADAAKRLGSTIHLFIKYGRPTVTQALLALKEGTATPEQQKICHELIQGLV